MTNQNEDLIHDWNVDPAPSFEVQLDDVPSERAFPENKPSERLASRV